MSDVLVGKCDNCGVNLWESDGYFENDNMCEECFREWDGLTTEEITEALEQTRSIVGRARIFIAAGWKRLKRKTGSGLMILERVRPITALEDGQ